MLGIDLYLIKKKTQTKKFYLRKKIQKKKKIPWPPHLHVHHVAKDGAENMASHLHILSPDIYIYISGKWFEDGTRE